MSSPSPGARALSGQTAVVTGAAGGIGEALAERLVREGARVVVSDRDGERLERVTERLGAEAIVADVSEAAGVHALIEQSRGLLGPIDVFVGNAGIERGRGLDAPDDAWQLSYDVNVMAHVWAARALMPEWLERGGGRYVMTVSAAGLLTMLGSPAYAVTKHAALAFAEWLSATYGGRGIVVQALCPQGVRTDLLPSEGPAADLLRSEGILEPADVADCLMAEWDSRRFLVLPHPQVARYYQARAADTDRWLERMRVLQAAMEDA